MLRTLYSFQYIKLVPRKQCFIFLVWMPVLIVLGKKNLYIHVLIFIHLPASSGVERLFLPSMTDLFFGDYSGAETCLNATFHKTVLCPTGNE